MLEDIAARGEPGDRDVVLAVVTWAVLVDAQATGRVHPLLSDPAFEAA